MDGSRFAKLPPEIRNQIYELALKHDEPIDFAWVRFGWLMRRSSFLPTHRLALTSTCKEIREECSKMFVAINTLQVTRASGSLHMGSELECVDVLDNLMKFIKVENNGPQPSILLDMGKFYYEGFSFIPRAAKKVLKWARTKNVPMKVRASIHVPKAHPAQLSLELDLCHLNSSCDAAIAKLRQFKQGPLIRYRYHRVLAELIDELEDLRE